MEINVKDIVVKVIPSKIANEFVKKHHYSGKVVNNSCLHFGCFYDNKLHGVMSYGPSMDKRRMLTIVSTENKTEATKWHEFLELNRMAFDDFLPKNSESRCLSVSFRLIRKNAPHIKYIISFSDGTASGDGTIYRASGFLLTQINKNQSILVFPDGERVASLSITSDFGVKRRLCEKYGLPVYSGASVKPFIEIGAKWADGFQLRYIKLLTPDCKINGDILPFSKIDEVGAGMWRGKKNNSSRKTQQKRDARRRLKLSGLVGISAAFLLGAKCSLIKLNPRLHLLNVAQKYKYKRKYKSYEQFY